MTAALPAPHVYQACPPASPPPSLGERDVALACIREALERHDPQFVIFSHGWLGANYLRDMPEHKAALRQIGLTQWLEANRD